jgi:hypothetical protein
MLTIIPFGFYLTVSYIKLKVKICKTIILPWSSTVRGENRLRMSEKLEPRRTLVPNREEVIGG